MSLLEHKSKDSHGHRSPVGRSFYSRGPAAKKLLSPNLLCVRDTSSFHMSLEFRIGLGPQWAAKSN